MTASKAGPVDWVVINSIVIIPEQWTFEWCVRGTAERKQEGAGAVLESLS